MKSNYRSHGHGGSSQMPTCENCIHTIRRKGPQDMVVCVPHLKTMPAGNFMVCELHELRSHRD